MISRNSLVRKVKQNFALRCVECFLNYQSQQRHYCLEQFKLSLGLKLIIVRKKRSKKKKLFPGVAFDFEKATVSISCTYYTLYQLKHYFFISFFLVISRIGVDLGVEGGCKKVPLPVFRL